MLLRSGLKVIYETNDVSAKSNAKVLKQFLKDKKLEDVYTEVSKFYELLLTALATNSPVEYIFFKLFVKFNGVGESFANFNFVNKLLQNKSKYTRFYEDFLIMQYFNFDELFVIIDVNNRQFPNFI